MTVAIAGGKFFVPKAGEAYDARASGPNRKSWITDNGFEK